MEQERKALRGISKALLTLSVALMVGANCASHTNSQPSNVAVSQNTPTPESATPTRSNRQSNPSDDSEEKKKVPPAFKNIDFKNFSYPTNFRKASIRLKDGSYEYPNRRGGGGDTFDLVDVDYVDLTGDGKKEAVVRLDWVSCGGSCDGGSDLFYFYSIKHGRPVLLSRIEMGSLGYYCGLKAFTLSKTNLTLETFRSCRFNCLSFKGAHDADETGGKFLTNRFTQFILRFNGRRFVLRKRNVFPYPENDFRGYEPRIRMSND
jgi:hypothetical protein